MRAVIVGGGIGGLAAAVALRRVGIESLIIERADAFVRSAPGFPSGPTQ